MAQQNEANEGFFGTVRNYIPGMATPQTGTGTGTETNTGYQQGILSYIPGFGGHQTNMTDTEGNIQSANQQTSNTGGYGGDNGTAADNYNSQQQGSTYNNNDEGVTNEGSAHKPVPSMNDYDTSYQGLGVGSKHHTGRGSASETPQETGQGYASNENGQGYGQGYGRNQTEQGYGRNQTEQGYGENQTGQGYGENQTGQGYGENQTGQGYGENTNEATLGQEGGSYGNQQQDGVDEGVRGAPIEGEGVKGYAVSAPVGSGDTNVRSNSGEPSGQVSGAHMQYNPEDTDTRDQTGRGTVGRTTGQGDSSFANVKRNIPWGTEHVVSKSSQSHIEHSSTTQM